MAKRRRHATPHQLYIIGYIGLCGAGSFFAMVAVIFFYDRDPVPILAQIGSITVAVITCLAAAYPLVGEVERNGVKPMLPDDYDERLEE